MKNPSSRIFTSWAWTAGFTALFVLLIAYVFWGTWSSDVTPVMPDDAVCHPLAYSEQLAGALRGFATGGSFSPVMVFWNGFLPQYGMQEFKYAVCLFLAGLALAFFLRERGLSRLASYGAGLLLAFCGYWMTLFSAGHGGWFVIMPFVVAAFAFMDRVACFGRLRDGILLGASVGWGACHQPDLFMLFAAFLAVYGIYACVRERRFPWKAGLLALAFFALVGGPGIRAAFTDALAGRDKQIEESKGSALSGGKGKTDQNATDAEKAKADAEARWIFVTNWSMPPEDTLEFFIPRIHGDTSCPMTLQLGRASGKDVKPYTGRLGRPLNAPAGNYRQHSLYVGWVTCLLALFAIVSGIIGWRRSTRRPLKHPSNLQPSNPLTFNPSNLHLSSDLLFFAIAAFVFWLFSMGRFCEPVYRLVYALPFGDYLRAPVKWHHVTEFCLCILAGFGLEALYGLLVRRGLGVRVATAIAAAVVVIGAADLARIDKLYCAPIDMHLVTGRNAAADEIVRRGKGTVCDFVEGGQGLVGWSFGAHGIGVTRDISAKDVRFVLVGIEQVSRNPQLANWLKANATPAGTYVLQRDAIRGAPSNLANVSLYQVNGVPPPPEPVQPKGKPVAVLIGILSYLATLAALILLFCPGRREVVTSEVGSHGDSPQ